MTHPLSKALREGVQNDGYDYEIAETNRLMAQAADALDARATTESECRKAATELKNLIIRGESLWLHSDTFLALIQRLTRPTVDRNAVIEECANRVEDFAGEVECPVFLASKIRALKEPTND